ncbi:MAG: hypothetical protein ABFD16_25960 [Thermoguttaceae bacterium]|jgi:hypothetical protein
MSDTLDRLEAEAPCKATTVSRRLRWLIAAHVVLGATSVLSVFLPPDARFQPVLWALCSVLLAQLMLLAFWAGMGGNRSVWRLLGALGGCAYVAVWPLLISVLLPYFAETSSGEWIYVYLPALLLISVMVLLLTGGCLVMRRWFVELRRLPQPIDTVRPPRFRYSILHLLVITSVVAVVLGLIRGARQDDSLAAQWHSLTLFALPIVVFLVNLVCATRAALDPGPIGRRVSLVFVVAILLGIALAFADRQDKIAWWLLPCSALVMTIPTAIVIASLLVVRSCGYRLIPKQSMNGP